MKAIELKSKILDDFHTSIKPIAERISASNIAHQKKAKEVNDSISSTRDQLLRNLPALINGGDLQEARIILQYCTSVISLEYRHLVWNYEYMALSRRVGELWERFCSAAWDTPARTGVTRFEAPKFTDIGEGLRKKIELKLDENLSKEEILGDIDRLFELVGEINMKEDEVFYVDGIPHVIDFKSGFGSNEKGNTLRLLTVGKAYKLWNPDTVLLFLVRQEQNNNYLNVIRRSGLWDVHCGSDAYRKIDELTGSNINALRENVVDFQADLSEKFLNDLSSQLSDLTEYLSW